MAWKTGVDIASSVLAIFAIIYYAGFFLYMIYVVIDNEIYENPDY